MILGLPYWDALSVALALGVLGWSLGGFRVYRDRRYRRCCGTCGGELSQTYSGRDVCIPCEQGRMWSNNSQEESYMIDIKIWLALMVDKIRRIVEIIKASK